MESKKVNIWLAIGIVFFPILFSWVTLKKGYSKKAKIFSLIWLALTIISIFSSTKNITASISSLTSILISGLFFFAVYKITLSILNLVNDSKKKKASTTLNDTQSVIDSFSPHKQQELTSQDLNLTNQSIEQQLTPRRKRALYNLALKILEDDVVSLDESKKLKSWLYKYAESKTDSSTRELYTAVEKVLEDKVLDDYESLELFSLLSDYCDDFEHQESVKEKTTKKVSSVSYDDPLPLLKNLNIGNEYHIQYQDSSGEISSRNIIIRNINDNYIKAFCLLRKSHRTFKADRIVYICDTETGECLS
ncbi:hypothetical protein [Photobacterium phosphoreum]|uniref:hypothetical protein n=1 Tax=Photobacterium phosphoreum TaxID=659 RepID=UPI0007F92346|nr:hypothetical protein [Photobacterium phosphoreum]OBU37436.1 hypothetical protein AYY24_11470 [Photobacterium phosphoreum]PSW38009.1 hypothetical protein CTM87_05545 [Photobacterium phosphoreum]